MYLFLYKLDFFSQSFKKWIDNEVICGNNCKLSALYYKRICIAKLNELDLYSGFDDNMVL